MGCDMSKKKKEEEFVHLGAILNSAAGSTGIGNIARMALVMGKESSNDKIEVEPKLSDLDAEERRLLKVTFCGLIMEKCPDFYQRIWLKSLEKAPNIVTIISSPAECPKLSYPLISIAQPNETLPSSGSETELSASPRKLTINDPCLLKMSRKVDGFFEQLLYEYNLNPHYAEEACYDLGQFHHAFNDRGLRPLHFDIFFHSLLEILENEIDFQDDHHRETTLRAWKKLAKYIIFHMNQGYQDKKNFSNATRDNKLTFV